MKCVTELSVAIISPLTRNVRAIIETASTWMHNLQKPLGPRPTFVFVAHPGEALKFPLAPHFICKYRFVSFVVGDTRIEITGHVATLIDWRKSFNLAHTFFLILAQQSQSYQTTPVQLSLLFQSCLVAAEDFLRTTVLVIRLQEKYRFRWRLLDLA